MAGIISNLGLGFEQALSLTNLIYCFLGVFLGTVVGVLPGLGPIATIAMLLPITYTLSPVTSLRQTAESEAPKQAAADPASIRKIIEHLNKKE